METTAAWGLVAVLLGCLLTWNGVRLNSINSNISKLWDALTSKDGALQRISSLEAEHKLIAKTVGQISRKCFGLSSEDCEGD